MSRHHTETSPCMLEVPFSTHVLCWHLQLAPGHESNLHLGWSCFDFPSWYNLPSLGRPGLWTLLLWGYLPAPRVESILLASVFLSPASGWGTPTWWGTQWAEPLVSHNLHGQRGSGQEWMSVWCIPSQCRNCKDQGREESLRVMGWRWEGKEAL